MKKTTRCSWLAAALVAAASGACAKKYVPGRETPAERDARMAWWREARFGMFVHWGLYAIPAGEWGTGKNHGEWILTTAQIPVAQYETFREKWNPERFDADAWVAAAKAAGMQYIVITTKHHDGFCLFDSKQTDYDVLSTPSRRDVMRELADACRRQGLRIGWYHSIMDWHHPDYLPRREWEKRSAEGADFERYTKYLRSQVTELLTNYGDIGVMWFDGEWESTWNHSLGQPLYDLCRTLQPRVIVNNRVDVGRDGMAGFTRGESAGDFGTPEQEIPARGLPGTDWETCMTMNDHWGYNRYDQNFKSSRDLVRMLVDIASKGGNFLLNVGPTAEGLLPAPSVERLREIGAWMAVNGDAIHGTTASPFDALPWGRCTVRRRGGRTTLYLHVFEWPKDGALVVPGIGNDPAGARLLGADGALPVRRAESDLVLTLPAAAPESPCPVVALEIVGEPVLYAAPEIRAAAPFFVKPLEVAIEPRSPGLEIRATTDGTDPNDRSPLVEGPLRIADSCVVKARAFHRGKAVSPVVVQPLGRVEPAPARPTGPDPLKGGLVSIRYEGSWDAIPNFAAMAPQSYAIAPAVRIEPGDDERFGRRIVGWLRIPEDDVYAFALASDDGSRLRIDDAVVVDHDGPHASSARQGFAPLGKGAHRVVIEYFNRTGGKDLSLRWAPLGGELAPVPAEALAHTAADYPEIGARPAVPH